ncbi:MAG: hypothetical protein M1826_006952 [Phylliscum demangeonii]|nr:MAG: hypothetical protein M1826_006952 [Phylliscum demangeonii]
MASLTIRNLTSTPLQFTHITRSTNPKSSKRLSRIARKVTEKAIARPVSTATGPPSQDVAFAINALFALKTNILAPDRVLKESITLTFGHDGELHEGTIPSQSNASTVSTALTANARSSYTIVYLPQDAYMTIFSSAALDGWMGRLHDETPLSAPSMPGTHNSPACYPALPSVRCQAVGVREQLDNGVRFLDLRVQVENADNRAQDGLILVHGAFPISLTGKKYLRPVVQEVLAFLDQHPTETVILSLKREGTGSATDAQLSQRLRDHYAVDATRWFTEPRMPSLGEARRKIVLLRRFALDDSLKSEWGGRGWCLDAESWHDNTADDTTPSGAVRVQDFYEVLQAATIDQKIRYVDDQLDRAAAVATILPSTVIAVTATPAPPPPPSPLFLNFLSGSNFWQPATWPQRVALKVNPAVVQYLCTRHHLQPDTGGPRDGDGGTGVVVCDWVGKDGDWDLVRCIVGMNAALERRESALPAPAS